MKNCFDESDEKLFQDGNYLLYIERKLIKNNFLIAIGDKEFYQKIEKIVYCEGGDPGEYMVPMIIPAGDKIISIRLYKKTERLSEFFQNKDLTDIISIEQVTITKDSKFFFLMDYEGTKLNDKETFPEFVSRRVRIMKQVMDYVSRTNKPVITYFEYPQIMEKKIENTDFSDPNNITPKTTSGKNKKRKKSNRKHISKSIRHEVFKRDNYRCVECGASKDDEGVVLHIDHIKPLAQGGTDELDNLQTLCKECNLAKGSRHWKGG